MNRIPVKECINLNSIIRRYGLEPYTMVNMQIGYDDALYLLFSARVPERIQGMFVDTQANTEYRALCLFIDWQDGSLLGEEVLEFGVRKMNFHFIQPIGDDILLLASRHPKDVEPDYQYQVWTAKTLDGNPFWGAGDFCGLDTEHVIRYGRELTDLECDGNEIYVSGGDAHEKAFGVSDGGRRRVIRDRGEEVWRREEWMKLGN